MKSRFIYSSFVALLLLLLCCCGKAPSADALLEPQPEPPADSTYTWLRSHENFYAENYYAVFNAYYAQQLHKKEYTAAAGVLKVVADHEMYFLFFDSAFTVSLESFDTLYADRLPWSKTLFVEEHRGYRFMDRGEFRKAIACFRRATAHEPFDYDSYLESANLYSDMAFCYSAIGNQEEALRYNHVALSYFSKINSLDGMGGVYDNIALVHLFTKNYTEAELYFDKAMQAHSEAGDTTNLFTTLHNRILLYEETNDLRKYPLIEATYYFFEARGEEDPSMEVALSTFYVEKLLHENRLAEAKAVLDKVQPLVEKQHSSSADGDYYIALAKYELKTHEGIVNIHLVEDALAAAEESEHYQNQLAFCEVLKENAKLQGDYKKALLYSEKEKAAMNNLANREMVVKTMELNKRHETEKKEQHIALQAETILNKNITIALLLVLIVTLCLGAAAIYSRQKQKKIRAESRRAILYTRQLLEKTEEERRRIAGDLHDSVSHELLILKNAIHGNDRATGEKIDAIINDIRVISRNLHPIMFEKVGLAASIEQLVERTQTTHDLMVTADISYDGHLSPSDELQVYRMVQEALSNIIKYAVAVAAKIVLFSHEDGLHVQIKDNGKGFDVAETLSGSTAFGLHNILERSKAIGGFAKIQSDKNGTVITIEIKRTA